ncbi:ATP-binding protein [Actinoallomurus sp. CA-142502]|uniref:ATP-binding protein n=1 Tax=Actinoallomurus sp. CA-142502 TaxID=3239885 RepID=UPI003D9160DF
MVAPRVRLSRSLEAKAIRRGHLVGRHRSPTWHRLPIASTSVSAARKVAAALLVDVAATDAQHVDDVILVVSELVTNAVRHAAGGKTLRLGVAVHDRWTHVLVEDPDSTVPAPPPDPDQLSESGRGLAEIVIPLCALFRFEVRRSGKVAHAVIARAPRQSSAGGASSV